MAYLHNTIDALNSESGELNERGKELQSKKKTINSPLTNPVSDPGPEPYWLLHPFKNGSWKLRKEAFDNFQKLTAEASRTLASIESEVNQVNAAFESKRKEIEAKKKEIDHITPDFEGARAELNRQELFVRIKGFLSHIWKTYIAMPMHLLLCISLLTITLKFALRVALINGWLGICQIILHRNDYYHRIK